MKQSRKKHRATLLGLMGLALVTTLQTGCGSAPNKTASAATPDGAIASNSKPAATDEAQTVQAVLPTRGDLVIKFEQPGSVKPFIEAEIYAQVGGYVKKVNVNIGDSVKAGQVLLEIDVPGLVQELEHQTALVHQAEAEFEQARSGVQTAEAELAGTEAQMSQADADIRKSTAERKFREEEWNRFSELAKEKATTPEVAEEKQFQLRSASAAFDSSVANRKVVDSDRVELAAKLQAAKSDVLAKAAQIEVAKSDRKRTMVLLEFASLKAPFDGVITRRTVDEGTYIHTPSGEMGTPIFKLARADLLTVVLQAPEQQVRWLHDGARAVIHLDALQGKAIEGRVARFSRALDPSSRTMRVEVDVENKSGDIYPGMYGSATIILQEFKNALRVPTSAVFLIEGQSFVTCVKNGKAHRAAVTTGFDDGITVQILSGLRDDDKVVVSNQGEIPEGEPLLVR